MKLEYTKPSIEATAMTPKNNIMIIISGKVEDPSISDAKKRWEEDESHTEDMSWGTIW